MKRNWLFSSFGMWTMLILALVLFHPLGAWAASAISALPPSAADGLAKLTAELATPIALGGAAAVPLHTLLENTIMAWLPSATTGPDGKVTGKGWLALRSILPLLFSSATSITTGLLGGASWLQIGLSIFTMWSGAVAMHELKPGVKGPMDPVMAAAMAQKQGGAAAGWPK